MHAVEVVVSGRVQGVFYRVSARDEATRLGVSGWIRNREDGAVVAHLEGADEAVDALVDWCREGPPAARVDAVAVSVVPPQGTSGFAVLH